MSAVKRIGLVVLYAIPPLFAALYAGATEIEDGSFTPWRPNMVDLDVYIRTAQLVLQGRDFYNIEAWLPWLYTPFAALLVLPFAFVGGVGSEIVWLVVNALMVMAIVYRLGFTGWRLSVVSVAAIWLIEPMRMTLGFGQVNLFLMALVVYDLIPGPRVLGNRRRVLPQGWLTGIAAAIKLTPALFAVYLFLAGRVKAAIVAFLSFLAATAIGFLILPGPSVEYWSRLAGGDSGLHPGMMQDYTNQSIIASYVRFVGEDPGTIPLGGLVLAAIVCLIGVVAAVLWHRLGHIGFAVGLAAMTALLGSPISWSHHFVWVLPLAIVLLMDTKLPDMVRFVGLVFSLWVMYAPFTQFPDDADEFRFSTGQKLIDAGSVILGLVLFFVAIGYALVQRRRHGLPWLPLTLKEHEVAPKAPRGKTGTAHE